MLEKYINKIILFADKNCKGCREAEEKLKDKIQSGEIEVIHLDDPEGRRIAELLRVKFVPDFAHVTKKGDTIKICRLDIFENKVKECYEI
jgi:predicted DCC family thiol-disulfide oxidoreductase YuxK